MPSLWGLLAHSGLTGSWTPSALLLATSLAPLLAATLALLVALLAVLALLSAATLALLVASLLTTLLAVLLAATSLTLLLAALLATLLVDATLTPLSATMVPFSSAWLLALLASLPSRLPTLVADLSGFVWIGLSLLVFSHSRSSWDQWERHDRRVLL